MSSILPEVNGGARSQSDAYFFCITGLKEPYSNWKRFKDHIRSLIPSNNPGWTSTGPQLTPAVREHWAYFSAKSWADADAAFLGLVNLRNRDWTNVSVHLFDTTGSTGQQYRLIRCNCDLLGLARPNTCAKYQGDESYSFPWTGIPALPSSHTTQQLSPSFGVGIQSMGMSSGRYPFQPPSSPNFATPLQFISTPTFGYPPPPQAHLMPPVAMGLPPFIQPVQFSVLQDQSRYIRNDDGIPVNVSKGAYVTESRAVLITNLSYTTKEADLARLLDKVVSAVRIDLSTDSRGKNKGSAVAHFATATEAQRVIKKLNNVKFAGKNLHMRADKNATATRSTSSSSLVIIDSSSSQSGRFTELERSSIALDTTGNTLSNHA